MRKYTVKEVSDLSGVSVRTLHHYDNIGLLAPSSKSNAGYRFYSEMDLYRLQQVLFYKEMDFKLKEIQNLLEKPEFDLIKSLESQKKALHAQKERLSRLVHTIDKTIEQLKSKEIMNDPQMLYEGLPKEFGTTLRDEAIEKYGDDVTKTEQYLSKLGKKEIEKLREEQRMINDQLFAHRDLAPESEKVQKLIAKHYSVIRKFWGTYQNEDKQADAYAGLGELYVSDERYTMVDGKPQQKYAEFLRDAMAYFAKNHLK